LDDFNGDEKTFKTWAGYSLICPDYSDFDGFQLQGSPAEMLSKNLKF
jgi:hypothetical protein